MGISATRIAALVYPQRTCIGNLIWPSENIPAISGQPMAERWRTQPYLHPQRTGFRKEWITGLVQAEKDLSREPTNRLACRHSLSGRSDLKWSVYGFFYGAKLTVQGHPVAHCSLAVQRAASILRRLHWPWPYLSLRAEISVSSRSGEGRGSENFEGGRMARNYNRHLEGGDRCSSSTHRSHCLSDTRKLDPNP